jgi:hypothetical protein
MYVYSLSRVNNLSESSLKFAYPFTLEPHIVTLESSRRSTIAAHGARRDAYLAQRADQREQRRRAALARIAPGFSEGAVLIPVKRTSILPGSVPASLLDADNELHAPGPKDVMADLVDELARLDAK